MPFSPLRRTPLAALCGLLLATLAAAAWDGAPNPHDSGHLVVLRASGFRTASGQPVKTTADPDAFGGQFVALAATAALEQEFEVRHAGDYVAWMRLRRATPVAAEVLRDGRVLAAATIGADGGGPGNGGTNGFGLYLEQAIRNTKDGALQARLKGYGSGVSEPAPPAGDANDELLETITSEIVASAGNPYITVGRVDPKSSGTPFVWLKAFRTKLEPGIYRLRLRAGGITPTLPAIDLAFLSTASDRDLAYPFTGDFSSEPGPYIRFRIDKLPKPGVAITASMLIHHNPFGAGPWNFNPDGFGKSATRHASAGYTRWYRLQDAKVENAPGYGGAALSLNFTVSDLKDAEGVTQFASAPHADAIVREFGWHEPDGLHLSMTMDGDRRPEWLRTFRDHEREHYEWALEAAGGQLFPLTPTKHLTFANCAGGASGAAQDYMYKVFRLLGLNAVSATDPLVYRRLYGGDLAGGHYWPPVFMPYDEDAARTQYADHYRDQFKAATYPATRIFQLADEPGEVDRERMSAPLWRFATNAAGGRWIDESGDSRMRTRRTDYRDCVLEAQVIPMAGVVELEVGTGDAAPPGTRGFWRVGRRPNSIYPENLAFGSGGEAPTAMVRRGFDLSSTQPATLKLVYGRGQALLYVNGINAATLQGLPEAGGFGIGGPRKAVLSLRIRPIQPDEQFPDRAPGADALDLDAKPKAEELAAEAETVAAPAEAPKPLRAFVEQDWVFSGGIPGAQEGFRKWAAAQGIAPDLFGRKRWEDVTMLTLPQMITSPEERRLYYWSRRYSGYLTPRMFALAGEAVHQAAPNPAMATFVALSGHSLYMGATAMPLDMFELARLGAECRMMAGVSDAMSYGGWRWDSHQSVAYSVAPYNSGVRVYGGRPAVFPMMHCDWPSTVRSYTMMANQVKHISYFWYGPSYAGTEWYWSESRSCYPAVSRTDNRASLAADIVGPGATRPSRVALLYAHSTEYWRSADSYADKRAAFIALAHEYYQPELVTEEQIRAGALSHYDALYVLEPNVADDVQKRIGGWVEQGGLLWACANALRYNEYNEPADLLRETAGLTRAFAGERDAVAADLSDTESRAGRAGGADTHSAPAPAAPPRRPTVAPVAGESDFAPHPAATEPPVRIGWADARVRARYDDGTPAWLEKPSGRGRIVYVGHRPGLTYSRQAVVLGGHENVWADAPRVPLAQPLLDARIPRELTLSEPVVMALPLDAEPGTAVVMVNMRPYAVGPLRIDLREAARPHSVQTFDSFRLVDVPFEFTNGMVHATLQRLDALEAQIVVVRRAEPPKDPRWDELRELADRNLSDADWRGVAAGAWMAGFLPESKLGARLPPLLTHRQPEVRRAAAESLGRLGSGAAALASAYGEEADAHVKADTLFALCQLQHADAMSLCLEAIGHRDAEVRRQAVLGLRLLALGGGTNAAPAAVRSAVSKAAAAALRDANARVFIPALQLYGELEPGPALDLALRFGTNDPALRLERQDERLAPLVQSKSVADAFAARGCPGGPPMLFAFARSHPKPEFAERLLQAPGDIPDAGVLLTQATPAFTRMLFPRRDQLAARVRPYLFIALERMFHAHLGHDERAWAEWLGKNNRDIAPDAAPAYDTRPRRP